MMELYYTKASPYANCVRVLCSELSVVDEISWVHSHPFENSTSFREASPLGKVPCLVVEDESIFDSEVICDYLDQRFADGKMHSEIKEDWGLCTSLSLIGGLMDVAVQRRLEAIRREEGLGSDFWWERQTKAIYRALEDLQKRSKYFPTAFCQLHINLVCALGYLDFRHPDIDWRHQVKELAASYSELKQRPSIKANPYIG